MVDMTILYRPRGYSVACYTSPRLPTALGREPAPTYPRVTEVAHTHWGRVRDFHLHGSCVGQWTGTDPTPSTFGSRELAVIEFVTLFLGSLFVGVRPVEVMVEPSVDAVELHLDGEAVARMERPPWVKEIDFGGELVPHLLEAVAFDASGREVDRSRQWINMSSHEVETIVMVDPGDNGVGAMARVGWESVTEQRQPTAAAIYFDGELLEEENLQAIPLPAFDPEEPHHLKVELEFAGSLSSSAEATFGGVFGEEVSTELTASVIELDKGRNSRSVRDLEGWFFAADEPLAVRAVEIGIAEILVVKDVAAQPFLDRLESDRKSSRDFRSSPTTDPLLRVEFVGSALLKKDHRLRLVAPCPVAIPRGDLEFTLFPTSREIKPESGGLVRALSEVRPDKCFPEDQMLADAVAVAGLTASTSGRRRAVVLILSRSPKDRSSFRPGQVRRYLERLGVPFEVWSVDKEVGESGGWGSAVCVSNPTRLGRAYGRLGKRLDRQRVVWLDGLHLPQSIRLHPKLKGVRLAH